MKREEYTLKMNELFASNNNFTYECNKSIDIKNEYILSLEAKIQELELIIKGKDVIIESMAQGKSYENCKHFMSNHSFKLGHSDYLNGCRVLITPSDFLCSDFKSKENQDVK